MDPRPPGGPQRQHLAPVDIDEARAFLRGLIRYNNGRGMALIAELVETIYMADRLTTLDLGNLTQMVLVDPVLEPFFEERMLQRQALSERCRRVTGMLREASLMAQSDIQQERQGAAAMPVDPSLQG
jgi:hypothetical protein